MDSQDVKKLDSKNPICHDNTSDNLNINHEESFEDKRDQSSTIDVKAASKHTSHNAEEQVLTFFTDRKILKLFNFLISHLLVAEPDDPIEYLYDIIDRCLLFRSGLAEPPLLFDRRHIESIFQSMDPIGSGSISLDGYKIGMMTLGIESYDEDPRQFLPGLVDKGVFVNEAKNCLVNTLSEMLEKPN